MSERAGHASVAIALDTYTHALPNRQADPAARFAAALRAQFER